jgi:N-acetyl-D-muramate 6-phosphate phosphatase
MNLKAVLFDLDGTLLDTAPDFKTALNLLLAEEGKSPLPEDEVKVMVSHGSADLIANAFHMESTHPDFEPLRARLLAFYLEHLSENTRYFEGLQPSLEYIKMQGLGYGIVTNKPSLYAEKILTDLQIEVDCLVCPDHVAKPKPDPEGLLLACEKIGCSAEQAIYVGDHVRDVDAAKAINMPTVAVAWGYIPAGESIEDWNADYLLQHPSDLLPLLQSLNESLNK